MCLRLLPAATKNCQQIEPFKTKCVQNFAPVSMALIKMRSTVKRYMEMVLTDELRRRLKSFLFDFSVEETTDPETHM